MKPSMNVPKIFFYISTGPKNNFFTLWLALPQWRANGYGAYYFSHYRKSFCRNLSTDKDQTYKKAVEVASDESAIKWERLDLETVPFGRGNV